MTLRAGPAEEFWRQPHIADGDHWRTSDFSCPARQVEVAAGELGQQEAPCAGVENVDASVLQEP